MGHMLCCMRTTLNLDDDLLRSAKQRAVADGRTLTRVIEDALRAALHEPSAGAAGPFRMMTFGAGGLRPGVDLNDSAGLRDLMDTGA